MQSGKGYKWDLSEVFATDDDFEQEFRSFMSDIEGIDRFKGKLSTSKDAVKSFLKMRDDLGRRLQKLSVYAYMSSDLDTRVAKTQDMAARADDAVTKFITMTSYAMPEFLSADEKMLKELSEEPEMVVYQHVLDDILRQKPYVLSAELENMLAMTSSLANGAEKAFKMVNNADSVWEDAIDSEGKAYPLNHAAYGSYLQSKDRVLRKDAFEKYHAWYKKHINTIAAILETEVKKNVFYAKARGHNSAREAALFEHNVPVSVMDNLIEVVNEYLPHLYKALELRKKVLGVEELHLYDNYVPLADCEFNIPFDEGKEIVKKAIAIYGEDYLNVASEGLESWADVYPAEGKRSGAYSGGAYDTKPYMLLNYNDTLSSVFTLAHELGHSMHSYYSIKTQEPVNANYPIFVAEVASNCNECLLNHYLLQHETDKEKRRYIIGNFIDNFRGSIFRQTMFAEFERDIHARVEEGGSLTAEFMCEHYLSLVKKYFGPDVVIDESIQYEWARIPHFYANFYVYQYATGLSAAVALSRQVIDGKPEKTLQFLCSGSSDYPIEILRKAGADMETETPVKEALKVFVETIKQYEDTM